MRLIDDRSIMFKEDVAFMIMERAIEPHRYRLEGELRISPIPEELENEVEVEVEIIENHENHEKHENHENHEILTDSINIEKLRIFIEEYRLNKIPRYIKSSPKPQNPKTPYVNYIETVKRKI